MIPHQLHVRKSEASAALAESAKAAASAKSENQQNQQRPSFYCLIHIYKRSLGHAERIREVEDWGPGLLFTQKRISKISKSQKISGATYISDVVF